MNRATHSPMKKQIIFRADDAGSCKSANTAILETVNSGPVRNVGIMACGPALEHAVELLGGLTGINFGLHATINAEWTRVKWRPVLPANRVASLVGDDGAFLPNAVVQHERGFSAGEVLDEIAAQLARARSLGVKISYLDEHMGFAWLAGVEEGLRALCAAEGLVFGRDVGNNRLDFQQQGERHERWISAIRTAGPGVYTIIAHPTTEFGDAVALAAPGKPEGEIARDRNLDRLALINPVLKRFLAAEEIDSVTYAEAAAIRN